MIDVNTLIKDFHKITWRYSMYQVFCDTIAMAAYSLSNGLESNPHALHESDKRREWWKLNNPRAYKREMAYLECAKRYTKKELELIAEIIAKLFLLLSEPTCGGAFSDYLGDIYMQLEMGNKYSGQFFTPYHVSRMMSEFQVADKDLPADIITVSDPCVGAGGIILAFADALSQRQVNYSMKMLAHCCDIDIKCVHMTYLQLSWAGIPAIIYHGNTLTQEMWDTWKTPAYIFNSLHFQSAIKKMYRSENSQLTIRPVIGPAFIFGGEEA